MDKGFYLYDMSLILIILFLLTGIIFSYWVWFYLSFKHLKELHSDPAIYQPGVSIIVCYKNAGVQIYHTIEAILKQQYNNFEVIAIDDYSSDDGPDRLKSMDDHRLILMTANLNRPGKKAALSEAIREAKNDILLFTDADCIPIGGEWISSMVKKMIEKEDIEIVLGYGPMNKKGGWLNRFSRFETIMTVMQYFSYAITGMTYMGVGRNLMYRKSLFESIQGFEKHLDLPSGDDDLLIAEGSTKNNVAVCLNDASFMYSDAKTTFFEFLHQKSRHISTSSRYSILHQLLLGIFASSQIGFYIIIFFSIIFGYLLWPVFISIIIFKWIFQMIFQYHIFKKLNGTDLFFLFPLLDIMLVIYYLVLPLYSTFRKKAW